MQPTLASLILGLLLLQVGSRAQTPQKPFPLKLQNSDLNHALVEMGRAGNVNFMADATEFSVDSPPISVESMRTLNQNLQEIAAPQQLSWLQEPQLLLIWTAPSVSQLAQQILAGDSVREVQRPEESAEEIASKPPLDLPKGATPLDISEAQTERDQAYLFKEALDYFREKQGWDSTKPGALSEVLVAELPAHLRDEIVASIQSSLQHQAEWDIWKAWYSDEFWNHARLQIVENGNRMAGAAPSRLLTVGGNMYSAKRNSGSMMSLGALEGNDN